MNPIDYIPPKRKDKKEVSHERNRKIYKYYNDAHKARNLNFYEEKIELKTSIACIARSGSNLFLYNLENLLGYFGGADLLNLSVSAEFIQHGFVRMMLDYVKLVRTHYPSASTLYFRQDHDPNFSYKVDRAIFLTRDPVSAIRSEARLTFSGSSHSRINDKPFTDRKAIEEYVRAGSYNYVTISEFWLKQEIPVLILRYEDWTKNPEKYFKEVLKFIGEEEKIQDVDEYFKKNGLISAFKSSTHDYKEDILNENDIDFIKYMTKKQRVFFGYETSNDYPEDNYLDFNNNRISKNSNFDKTLTLKTLPDTGENCFVTEYVSTFKDPFMKNFDFKIPNPNTDSSAAKSNYLMEGKQPPQSERAFKYFDLYGSMRSHKVMLEDRARMEAYHSAIFKNKLEMIADKVVLDVGTGTGVLAVWAAKAGAKRVYAVDASNAAKFARRLVESSNLSDVVTILNSKVEEVEIPEPVDVIVSEWMGSLLIKESMFDSVAYARDKWLKPGGLMFPNRATILLGLYAPDQESDRTHSVKAKLEKEIAEWKETVTNLQGLDVDYSGFTDELVQDLSDYFLKNNIRVNYLSPNDLASAPQKVLEFDCATVDPTALVQFSQDFEYTITKHAEIEGFLGWFTTDFPNGVILDTGPGATYNHWGQQLYPLQESFKVAPGDRVVGTITVSRDPDEPRFNVVEFKYQVGMGPEKTAVVNMGNVQHLDEWSKTFLH